MSDVRADDNYIVGGFPEAFYPELALAFAALVTHGNGGSFRLTLKARDELGDVKITRERDGETGDVIFRVEEAAK